MRRIHSWVIMAPMQRAIIVLRKVGVASGRKIGAYLTRADYARFEAVAEASGVPQTVLVRMALADALPRWESALAADRTALLGAHKEAT